MYMTGRVRRRVHGLCTRTCTQPCTGRVHGPCIALHMAVYMAVYIARTRPCNGSVHVCTCSTAVYRPCDKAMNGPCRRPLTGRIGRCTRPCTGRVHGSCAVYYYDFLCKDTIYAETYSYTSITFDYKTKLESVSLSCKSHRSKTANIKILSANSTHRR